MKKILIKIISLAFVLILVLPSSSFARNEGDAMFRAGGYLNFFGHAGVYNAIGYAYEILFGGSVELVTTTAFEDGQTFYGYFKNSTMSTTDRENIKDTLFDLNADSTLSYTASGQLYHDSNPGTYINYAEITDIRCDGLVEYAYEWNNVYVWGRSSNGLSTGTPQHYDISVAAYVSEHKNLGEDEPWIEVSPDVQRGASGSTWTKLVANP